MAVSSLKTNMSDVSGPRTLIGWHGVRFTLPPDWNLMTYSLDPSEGYLKVDSPDNNMFVQVKWTRPSIKPARSLAGMTMNFIRKHAMKPVVDTSELDLRQVLDNFLKSAEKKTKKTKTSFDCKVKPRSEEANGIRIAHPFSWSGGGYGQGKIWHCKECGKVVIAQVVGQNRDEVGKVAAALLSDFHDHSEGGWDVWALYDLVASIPSDYRLANQNLHFGQLRLEFDKPGGDKIILDRWGLADVLKKRVPIEEWFYNTYDLKRPKVQKTQMQVQGHSAYRVKRKIRDPLDLLRIYKDAGLSMRPAHYYDACCWECEETNKIYAIQVWHNRTVQGLLESVAERCECH